MKNWLLVAGGVFTVLAIVACGIGGIFSDTIEPHSKTVATKVVTSKNVSSDEVNAERLFSVLFQVSASSTEPLSTHEIRARSVGFSFEAPMRLSVETKTK